MEYFLIGDVAARTGVPPPTIRYYERIGLLTPPLRLESGYRRYSERTIEELTFVRKAQALGFSLDEIAQILRLTRAGKMPCERVLSLAHEHLAVIDERISQLQRYREQLAFEVAKWDSGTIATCEGLCQIVSTADIQVADAVPERLDGPAQRVAARRMRSSARR